MPSRTFSAFKAVGGRTPPMEITMLLADPEAIRLDYIRPSLNIIILYESYTKKWISD